RGAPRAGRADDRGEPDPAAAGGVRRPPAAPGRAVPGRGPRAGGAGARQRPLAPGQAGRRRLGGEPAPGAVSAAELRPAAERDRAVLEAAAAPRRARPAARHPGGPEAVDPRQPVLLPDDNGLGQAAEQGLLRTPRKPERIRGLVNKPG